MQLLIFPENAEFQSTFPASGHIPGGAGHLPCVGGGTHRL